MSPSRKPTKVAVIGVGRMGRHHARIYHFLPQAELVGVVDHELQRAEIVAEEYQCNSYESLTDLLDKQPELSAASIAAGGRSAAIASLDIYYPGAILSSGSGKWWMN